MQRALWPYKIENMVALPTNYQGCGQGFMWGLLSPEDGNDICDSISGEGRSAYSGIPSMGDQSSSYV